MVKGTRRLTQHVEDVVESATTNKNILALHAHTHRQEHANVTFIPYQDGWSQKIQQRKGTGTGRMRYLKTIPRIFKNKIKGLAK